MSWLWSDDDCLIIMGSQFSHLLSANSSPQIEKACQWGVTDICSTLINTCHKHAADHVSCFKDGAWQRYFKVWNKYATLLIIPSWGYICISGHLWNWAIVMHAFIQCTTVNFLSHPNGAFPSKDEKNTDVHVLFKKTKWQKKNPYMFDIRQTISESSKTSPKPVAILTQLNILHCFTFSCYV